MNAEEINKGGYNMIEFIIYLIGVGVMISGLYYAHKNEDVTI